MHELAHKHGYTPHIRARVRLERWDEGPPEIPLEVDVEPPRAEPPRAASGSG